MRRRAGEQVDALTLQTLSHGVRVVPDGARGLTHLSFRRFAGCPICNLHLRSIAARHEELEAAGIRTIAFFHSSADAMRPYQGDLPFPIVADPDKVHYRAFGVEAAPLAMLHPRAAFAAMRGMLTVPSNPMVGEGGHTGLPAEFLVDGLGRIVAVHYGAHPADAWDATALLERVTRAQRLA